MVTAVVEAANELGVGNGTVRETELSEPARGVDAERGERRLSERSMKLRHVVGVARVGDADRAPVVARRQRRQRPEQVVAGRAAKRHERGIVRRRVGGLGVADVAEQQGDRAQRTEVRREVVQDAISLTQEARRLGYM